MQDASLLELSGEIGADFVAFRFGKGDVNDGAGEIGQFATGHGRAARVTFYNVDTSIARMVGDQFCR